MPSDAQGYHVEAILGEGSTAMVVLARPIGEDRQVVVKVLQRELLAHEGLIARTRDEARLLALISHPNIVAVEALVVHHGHPLVVMEYVEGIDLGAMLRGTGAIPYAESLEITRRTAEALHAVTTAPSPDDRSPLVGGAHPGKPLGVIHRDIKPSNLLLSTAGEVKVVDFGLARAEFTGREARTDAFVLGSMGFVAPERYEALVSTPAVDIYALGVTLTQLLTARPLVLPRIRERHDYERERQLRQMSLPTVDDGLRADTVGLVSEMCAFDPEQRPVAAQVVQRIEALLARAPAPPDLAGFAAARIPEARARRPVVSPHDHPAWADLAFLERPGPRGRRTLDRLLAWIGIAP